MQMKRFSEWASFPRTQIVVVDPSPASTSESLTEVFIQSIDKSFTVMSSFVRPKRITLRSTDGRSYHVLCKGEDELRKDARFQQVATMVNCLMRQNADARKRDLSVRTFTVVPVQSHGGLIEWVPNLSAFRGLLDPLFREHNGGHKPSEQELWRPCQQGPIEDRLRHMREKVFAKFPLVMAEWFRREFPDPCAWYAARTAFARSSAVMSILGFVLGLGDRHGENILVDLSTGQVVHVDFNLIFNKGETLPVPELVPFRLTRNMIDGMGACGVEGVFRAAATHTLRVLRDHKDTILTVVQTFVHDPLVEWSSNESRAQQYRQANNAGRAGQKSATESAKEAIDLVARRLSGHIVTPRLNRDPFNCAPMSVDGQVTKLIEIATDDEKLVLMYIGWASYI